MEPPAHPGSVPNAVPLRPASAAHGTAVEQAGCADCAATAHTHIDLLPFGLFPCLGPTFMRRWHRTFVDSSHAVALVARHGAGGDVCGFLLGTTDQAAHVADIVGDRRALGGLATTGVLALLGKPQLAVRFARTRVWPYARALVRAARRRRGAPGAPAQRVAVLTAVAVDPALRGRGVGAELVERFLSEAAHAGAGVAELATDARNLGAGAFYAQLGWVQTADHLTRDGLLVLGYRHAVGRPPSGEGGAR
jgi:GNAT superfamily N-acetyltransferase